MCLECEKGEKSGDSPVNKKKKVSDSKSDDDDYVESSTISRFHFHTNAEYSYLITVPDKMKSTFCQIVAKAFGIEKRRSLKFKSLKDAKEYFFRRYYYAKDRINFFDFTLPPCLVKDDDTESEDEDDINCELTFEDIVSVIENKPIMSGIVDFVLHALNYYSHHEIGSRDVPNFIFGPTDALDKIIPSSTNFEKIHQFFNKSTSTTSSKEPYDLSKDIKEWYYASDKGFVTRVLDKYHARNFIINNFSTIQEQENGDYVYYTVHFDESSKNPVDSKVVSYDFNDSNGVNLDHSRAWICKYFGLYLKDMNSTQKFNDKDFSGHDIKLMLTNPEIIDDEGPTSSIIPGKLSSISSDFYSKENSGILCLYKSISHLSGTSSLNQMGKTNESRQKFFETMRLSILSIIANTYEMLNNHQYEKFQNHLEMKHGFVENKFDLEKWKNIHQLCNLQIYDVDLENDIDANHYYKEKSHLDVKKDIASLVSKSNPKKRKKQTRVRNNEGATTPKKLSNIERMNREDTDLFLLANNWPFRYNPIFDTSEKTLVLAPKKGIKEDDTFPAHHLMKPSEATDDILRLLSQRYMPFGASDNEAMLLERKICILMKSYFMKIYSTFDISQFSNQTTPQYNPVASFILEESLVFQDGSDCAIIHILATEFGFENTYQLRSLLYATFSQEHLKDKTVVFVYQFGRYLFNPSKEDEELPDMLDYKTHADLFRDMGFIYRDVREVKKEILKDSKTMIGTAKDIVEYCKDKWYKNQLKRLIYDNTNVHTCMSNRFKFKYKYENEDFQVFSHMFGWQVATHKDENRIKHKRYAIDNPGEEIFFYGSGRREGSQGINPNAEYDFSVPIEKKFQQNTYTVDDMCVWLNTALVIDRMSKFDSNEMINLFNEHPKKSHFSMMSIKKHSNDTLSIKEGIETLQQKLNKNIGYNLLKVPRTNRNGYIDQFLNDTSSGKFIAQLRFEGKENFHLVGIDCDAKLIFDCYEQYALKLTRNNMSCCAGYDGAKIAKIPFCFELQSNNKKRKSRNS